MFRICEIMVQYRKQRKSMTWHSLCLQLILNYKIIFMAINYLNAFLDYVLSFLFLINWSLSLILGGGGVSLFERGGWTRWPLKVLSNLNHSAIVWFLWFYPSLRRVKILKGFLSNLKIKFPFNSTVGCSSVSSTSRYLHELKNWEDFILCPILRSQS